MFILRQKIFGQVKKENKLKKKAWEFENGKNHIKSDYKNYINHSGENISIDDFADYKIDNRSRGILGFRSFKNNFDDNKLEKLPKLSINDSVRGLSRDYNSKLPIDELEKKLNSKIWYGDLKDYYKSKGDRIKFDNLKGKNKRDLINFITNENNKLSSPEPNPEVKKNSIPFVKKVRRLFKKNINKLIK